MSTLNIALLTVEFPPKWYGGIGSYCYELAKFLTWEDVGVEVVTREIFESRDYPFRVHKVFSLSLPLLSPLTFSLTARKHMETISSKVDLIHAHSSVFPQAISSKTRDNVNMVFTLHGTYYQEYLAVRNCSFPELEATAISLKIFHRLNEIAERKMAEMSDMIIAVSEDTRKYAIEYYGIDKEKIRVIPNFVDVSHFSEVKGEKAHNHFADLLGDPTILFVGRLVPRKGVKYLLFAVSELAKEFPEIKLIIIGSGGLRRGLVNMCHDLNIMRHVHFTEFLPEEQLPEAYQIADIFVLPSLYEGFGIPIVEAMASGTPVIATNVGGIPEILANSGAGIVIPPGDARALTKALRLLAENPSVRRKMGERGLRIAREKYDWKKRIGDVIQLYKEVISGSSI